MLWFYSRDRETLHLETRYDNQTREYVAIVIYPDGHREATRCATAKALQAWLLAFEEGLAADRWSQDGGPLILRDGWPTTRPPE